MENILKMIETLKTEIENEITYRNKETKLLELFINHKGLNYEFHKMLDILEKEYEEYYKHLPL